MLVMTSYADSNIKTNSLAFKLIDRAEVIYQTVLAGDTADKPTPPINSADA